MKLRSLKFAPAPSAAPPDAPAPCCSCFRAHSRSTILLFVGAIVIAALVVFVALIAFHPQVAFAAEGNGTIGDGPYMDIDVKQAAEGQTFFSGLMTMTDNIVSYILLPLVILYLGWKIIYLALFPMMAGIDPLRMVVNFMTTGQQKRQTSNRNQMWGGITNFGSGTAASKSNGAMGGRGDVTASKKLTADGVRDYVLRANARMLIRFYLKSFLENILVVILVWFVFKLILFFVSSVLSGFSDISFF